MTFKIHNAEGPESHYHLLKFPILYNCFLTFYFINLGITELQSINDVGYLRKTLAVEKTDKEALAYFQVFLKISFNSLLATLSCSFVILQCRPGTINLFMIGLNSISLTRQSL